jgi:MoaA/NifB/PqqE/SkfB family radical SAM enzyme
MKRGFLRQFLFGSSGKAFGAWQIELTTRCPLRCKMCVREQCPGRPRQDMAYEDFQKILPYLRDVESVVLEGWGESLLHPQLVPIVRSAKKKGPRVGFVTSVMGLNPSSIEGLVDAGLDFMGFSLAGATPGTHNSIRVHSDLDRLLQGIRSLQNLKARRRSEVPRLHIVYLLLKDNILEAPQIIDLAHELEIREVILIHLAQVSNRWQDEQKCFSRQGFPEFETILQEVESKARKLKISVRCPPLSAREVPVCSEDPLRNLYISVTGNVSPCVYLNPPVDSPFLRIYDGKDFRIEKVKFGNILVEPFEEIWHREAYEDFRASFVKRKKKFDELYESLFNPDRFPSLDQGPLPLPPQPCQTCHKMWGV